MIAFMGGMVITMHRVFILVALAATVLLVAASTASAAIVTIRPSGEISSNSQGKVRLVFNGERTVECRVSLRGTLAREVAGTLTESPDPTRNAAIGSLTGGESTECTGAGRLIKLIGGRERKYVLGRIVGHPEQWAMYLLDYEVLYEDALALVECLYRERIDYTYEEETGELIIVRVRVLAEIPLSLLRCVPVTSVTGVLGLEEAGGRGHPRITLST
jgi:hypothetical protein